MFGEYHIAQMQHGGLAWVYIRRWAQDEMHEGIVCFDLVSFDGGGIEKTQARQDERHFLYKYCNASVQFRGGLKQQ